MLNSDYMVVAEIVNKVGYIVSYKIKQKDAQILAKKFFDKFSFREPSKIINKIPYVHKYKLNQNSLYLLKDESCITNGELSVSVVKIDGKNFCPQMFIKERQNSSIILELFIEGNKYFELFEESAFYAN